MSPRYGQVVYPAFFESRDFMRKGHLQLCAFPGFLHMNGMRFDNLVDECYHTNGSRIGPSRQCHRFTARQRRKFMCPEYFVSPHPTSIPDTSFCWTISVQDDGLLGRLHLGSAEPEILPAWELIRAVCCLLLTPPCEHESSSPAGDLTRRFCLDAMPVGEDSSPLLFSAGREYLRQLSWLYAYCVHVGFRKGYDLNRVVLHSEGCIRCALKLCLASGASAVIS
jgi:hypothetical protein